MYVEPVASIGGFDARGAAACSHASAGRKPTTKYLPVRWWQAGGTLRLLIEETQC